MPLKNDPWGANGRRSLLQALRLSSYTLPALPPAASHRGRLIEVTNGNAGALCIAYSNGTDWLRVLAGTAVAEIGSAYAAHVQADAPTLYWRLDEWKDGVLDSSGNNRNGAAINLTGAMRSEPGPLRAETATCFRFDGAQRGVLSAANAAQLGIDGTKAKTIEAWIRADGLGIGFTGAWEIGSRVNGQYMALTHTDAETGYAINTYGPNATFVGAAHGAWMLVHVVYDPAEPTNKLKAYVNGVLAVQSGNPANLGTTVPFLVGHLDNRQFVGAIAEVAVFDKVLAPARMLERYALAGIGTLPVPYQSEVLADRPKLFWRNHLPDPDKHLTPDLSGNNFGGDVFYVTRPVPGAILSGPGDTAFEWTLAGHGVGKTQQVIQSNGLEGSGFATGANLGIDGAAASWTVEAWVYPSGNHHFRGVWEMGLKAAGQFVALHTGAAGDPKLYLHTWFAAPAGAGVAVPWDAWTLVHVCYDHTTTTASVYLNGAADAAYSVTCAIALPAAGWSFAIGRLDANQWLGRLDEAAVYQGVLPASRRAARWTASGRT